MEASTAAGETTVDTPSAVSMRTWEVGSARLGATTQGWRPISVKSQPKEQATKGSHAVRRAAAPRRGSDTRRPERVSHRAAAPMAAEARPRPIMRRKDQKVAISSGV